MHSYKKDWFCKKKKQKKNLKEALYDVIMADICSKDLKFLKEVFLTDQYKKDIQKPEHW